MLILLKIKM